jgi:hypothetical protein
MLIEMLEETYPVHPQVERRGRGRRLQEDATIAIRHGKRSQDFAHTTLIESTRHGARLIMSGSARRDDGIEFIVHMGRNTFSGQARVAWTQPLSNDRAVVGLEFITFRPAS